MWFLVWCCTKICHKRDREDIWAITVLQAQCMKEYCFAPTSLRNEDIKHTVNLCTILSCIKTETVDQHEKDTMDLKSAHFKMQIYLGIILLHPISETPTLILLDEPISANKYIMGNSRMAWLY